MRKKSRLFAIAEALRARRTGVTAAELAQRFNVTLRTIYRDLEALQDAGMPIKADRGRGGGYALDKNYQLPPVNFTALSVRFPPAISNRRNCVGPFFRLIVAPLPSIVIGVVINGSPFSPLFTCVST